MAIKVGINGFGRIGRQVMKVMKEKYPNDIDVVAFNDLGDLKTMAQLFRYDSNYGAFEGTVEVTDDGLIIDGDKPKYVATIVNWSTDITRIGLKTLIEYIRTKKVPQYTSTDELSAYSKQISDPTKYIKTGTVLVNEENAKDYYNPNAVF